MSSDFRKHPRKEDLSFYTDISQDKPLFTYETIGRAIKSVCKSALALFSSDDDDKALPYNMRKSCFYTHTHKYRKVPTKPLPSNLLEKLKSIRKGFDPLSITLDRWKRQDQEAKLDQEEREETEKNALIMRSSKNREIDDALNQSKKKIIKRYHLPLEEENDCPRWVQLQKKIEITATSTKSTEIDQNEKKELAQVNNKSQDEDSSEPTTPAQSQEVDPQNVSIEEKQEKKLLQSNFSTSADSVLTIEQKNEALPILNNITVEQKIEPKEEQTTKPIVNPFKDTSTKPNLGLMDLITKSTSSTSIFAPQNSQSQQVNKPFSTFQTPKNDQNSNLFQSAPPSFVSNHLNQTNPFSNQQRNIVHDQTPPSFSGFMQNNYNYSNNSSNNNQNQALSNNPRMHQTAPYQQNNQNHHNSQPYSPGSNYFAAAVTNPNVRNSSLNLFEEQSNHETKSLFDTRSGKSGKTINKNQGYNHKHKNKGPVRVS